MNPFHVHTPPKLAIVSIDAEKNLMTALSGSTRILRELATKVVQAYAPLGHSRVWCAMPVVGAWPLYPKLKYKLRSVRSHPVASGNSPPPPAHMLY